MPRRLVSIALSSQTGQGDTHHAAQLLKLGGDGVADQVALLQNVLGIPASIAPIGVIALGYDDEGPLSPERRQRFRSRRRPASETVHRERW